jgi:hypothetical protein
MHLFMVLFNDALKSFEHRAAISVCMQKLLRYDNNRTYVYA